MHGLKRPFLHEWLQIEIDYLQKNWEWYDAFESFENVKFDANDFILFFFIKVVSLTYAMHTLWFCWIEIYKVFYFYDLYELVFQLRSWPFIVVVYLNPMNLWNWLLNI
jgi:hypothetical protein